MHSVLIGYLHESLHQPGTALEHYARGSLVDQKRLMFCLVQQFLMHIDKLQLMKLQSEPSSPSHPGASPLPNPITALSSILASYKKHSENSGAPPVTVFLENSKAISPLVGMQVGQ